MGFDYTLKQKNAINHEGENILVSAGAGSGKTAVLTARVIRKIRDGVPVENLIILTFTNAAAAEMKERIRRALSSEADGNKMIHRALESLDSAHIRTFDSYAYYLLKKYGHHKNISKNLKIGDTAEFSVMKKTLVDGVFGDFYKSGDEAFINYLDLFSYKDSSRAKNQILYFHEALSLHYDKEAFLSDVLSTYFTRPHFETLFSRYELIVLEEITTMKERLHTLFDEPFCEEILNYLESFKAVLDPLLNCEDYPCVYEILMRDFKLPSTAGLTRKLKDTPEESELKHIKRETKVIKEMIKKLKGTPSDPGPLQKSKEDHFEGYLATEPHIGVIIHILRTFDERYQEKMKKEEHFDFSAVARTALDILYETPSVIDELKASINEIMVDEYQDTNAMQEAFLTTMATDNLYMVGDVKQSIYRFRHADPTIFVGKYLKYRNGEGGYLIDLTDNFRSRDEIITPINTLFSHVMDETVGGVTYDDLQALHAKNSIYEKFKDDTLGHGLELFTYKEDSVESLNPTFTKKEIEMFFIAHDIKTKMNAGAKVVANDSLKNLKYGDHAILVDRKTDFDTFKKVFEYIGVPLTLHREQKFLGNEEIILVRQILTLIASFKDDEAYEQSFTHAFMSTMRSFAFNEKDDLIVSQVLEFKKRRPRSKKAFFEMITPAFRPFFETLTDLEKTLGTNPLSTFLESAINTFDIHKHTVHLKDSASARTRLEYLVEIAEKNAARGRDLKAFLSYLSEVLDSELDIALGMKQTFSEDTVHIMTIHKSKGLEFPVIYLPHLFNKFQSDTTSERFRKDLGFLIKYDNDGLDEHFLYPLYKTEEKTADVSERLRVLYVAMTRAKERLVVPFYKAKDPDIYSVDDHDLIDLYTRRHYRSFHEVFESVLERFDKVETPINLDELQLSHAYRFVKRDALSIEGSHREKIYTRVGEEKIIKKTSAFSKGVSDLLDIETLNALEYGNDMHEVFETLDFYAPINPQLSAFGLTKDVRNSVLAFFTHPLIKDLSLKGVYKEYPFALEKNATIESGFIDLLLETDEAFLIIDYKLKDIEKTAYIDQVEGYANMLKNVVDKPVKGYLYSIIERRFKQIV